MQSISKLNHGLFSASLCWSFSPGCRVLSTALVEDEGPDVFVRISRRLLLGSWRQLQIDDYLMLLALVSSTSCLVHFSIVARISNIPLLSSNLLFDRSNRVQASSSYLQLSVYLHKCHRFCQPNRSESRQLSAPGSISDPIARRYRKCGVWQQMCVYY